MEKRKKKIQPEEWYTMSDIVKNHWFSWAKSFRKVRNIVKADIDNKNILKPKIEGVGTGTKYHFKGANIIKFLEAVEAGKVN